MLTLCAGGPQRRAGNQQSILTYSNRSSWVAEVKHWSLLKANMSAKKGRVPGTMQSYLARLSVVPPRKIHHWDLLRTCLHPLQQHHGETKKKKKQITVLLSKYPIPKEVQEPYSFNNRTTFFSQPPKCACSFGCLRCLQFAKQQNKMALFKNWAEPDKISVT